MLLVALTIGDHSLTLHRVEPLAGKADLLGPIHLLHMMDLPTGRTAQLSIPNEKEALLCVAAWIAADEPAIGDLKIQRAYLKQHLPKWCMP